MIDPRRHAYPAKPDTKFDILPDTEYLEKYPAFYLVV